jgi:hypothetical protein
VIVVAFSFPLAHPLTKWRRKVAKGFWVGVRLTV